jgi:hypothetical protein
MHNRRVASFLIGAWLLGSLFMFFVATQNFRGVERLLEAPTAASSQRLEALGKDDARLFLRFQASELNRYFFASWERAQLFIGVLLVLVMMRGSTRMIVIAMPLTMLIIAALGHWVLSPEINRLGAAMDFVPNARDTEIGKEFWRYHQAYSTGEVVKFLIGSVFAFLLLSRWKSLSAKQIEPEI